MFRITFIVVFICLFGLVTTSFGQAPQSVVKIGDNAINFSGFDQFGDDFNLSKALEDGPVVLLFYRGHWCPYCRKQLSQMEDSLSFITDRGGIVVAVTPEKPEYIEKTIKKTDASFYIIHDKDLRIMNAYGVSFELEDMMVEKYKNEGIDVMATNGDNGAFLPVPATYIISQKNKLLYVFYDPDYKKRATVKKILQNL
ncbi:MAG: AhpC/TSA family protein [Reichenbachiella sp.]